MAGLTREDFFATLFAAASPGEQIKITIVSQEGRPLLKKPYDTEPLTPSINDEYLKDNKLNVYFSVIPRRGDSPGLATCVWLDRDEDETPFEQLLEEIKPQPTAIVRSGHGWHIYWGLTTGVEPEKAIVLGKLAQTIYKGDANVYDVARSMRVPFSWNTHADKKKPLAYCELRALQETLYDTEDLQDALIAQLLVPYWTSGQRQSLSIGFAGYLARADYSDIRAEALVRNICGQAGDDEENDRIAVLHRTLERKSRGDKNSMAGVRDNLDPQVYAALMQLLDDNGKNGNLFLDGEPIGWKSTLERDVSDFLYQQGDTAEIDGTSHWWTGKIWKPQERKALQGYVLEVLRGIKYVDKDGWERSVPFNTDDMKKTAEMLESQCAFRPLDSVPQSSLIPLKNGVVDLETGAMYPPARQYGNRWTLDFNYEPEATCPRWLDFLNYATESPDNRVATFLQEWVGYMLMVDNPWQKMLWLYGLTGTGKSTFLSVIIGLFGPAHVSVNPHHLDDYNIAKLSAAKIATCSELDQTTLKTDRLKALISGDTINARHPYGRPFDHRFTGKLLFASNGLPYVSESDGYFRRLDVVPFNHAPAMDKKDPFISVKLLAELPGVFNWAIEGWRRQQLFKEAGFWPVPQEVIDEGERYQNSADSMVLFFTDMMEMNENAEESAASIYAAYKQWCQQQTFKPLPHSQKFSHELRRMGLVQVGPKAFGTDGRKVRGWKGARLRSTLISRPLQEEEASRLIREAVTLH